MNFGFGLAGIVRPARLGLAGRPDRKLTRPFAGSIALLAGAGLAFLILPDRPFEPEAEAQDPVFAE